MGRAHLDLFIAYFRFPVTPVLDIKQYFNCCCGIFLDSYKENVMRLSKIHHDRPISAKDEAVFWIEYTMRNQGAKHLRVAAHQLTWYQYHCLDVGLFFITIFLVLALLSVKTCSFCVRMCRGGRGKTKSKGD